MDLIEKALEEEAITSIAAATVQQRAVFSKRETALRDFMTGRLAIRDWPFDDFQLAICAGCGLLTTLCPAPPSATLAPLVLEGARGGLWQCEECDPVAAWFKG